MMIAVTRIEKISSRSEAERKLDYQIETQESLSKTKARAW